MPNHSPIPRQIPRLLSPRLPVGRRWATFCRCEFVGHLRASARGALTSLTLVATVALFYVGIPDFYLAYLRLGGAA